MRYLKTYNEASGYEDVPKILSYYDNKDDEKEEALDEFFGYFDNDLDTLLSKFEIKKDRIPSGQYNYNEEVSKIKKKLNKVLGEVLENGLNIDLEDIQSDVVDIDVLSKMDNEVDSIGEGDEVIAIIKKPFYTQNREMPGKTMIIEFVVQGPNSVGINWLGLAGNKSNIGMLRLEWCDLVVKKESYNSFVSPDKRI